MANADRPALPVPSKSVAPGVWHVAYSARVWISIAAAGVATIAVVLLLRFFPFSEKNVAESLQETFPSLVSIDRFEKVYLPRPGCRAEGVTFRSKSNPTGSQALVTIQKLAIQGSYADLVWRPHHIAKVYLDGLRIQVPPLTNVGAFRGGYTDSRTTIGELFANGALIEFARADRRPATRFEIHELNLENVSAKAGMSYRVSLRNPAPPGEIKAAGHFGPFNAGQPGQTPVSGKYSFDHGDATVS